MARILGDWDVAGFIDDVDATRWGQDFCGGRVLGGREVLEGLPTRGCRDLFLAFGANAPRLSLARELVDAGTFSFPSLVHPYAWVDPTASLGDGVLVGAGAVVNAGATVGDFAIVNTRAVVEHDVRVDQGAHVGPGACLTGGVVVGECAWVGAAASVRNGLSVGARAVVGMGAVVVDDVPDDSVVVGCPARPISERRG